METHIQDVWNEALKARGRESQMAGWLKREDKAEDNRERGRKRGRHTAGMHMLSGLSDSKQTEG